MHSVHSYVKELCTVKHGLTADKITALSPSLTDVAAWPLGLWLDAISIWLWRLLGTSYHLNLSLLLTEHRIRLVSSVLNHGRVPCPHVIAFVALIN